MNVLLKHPVIITLAALVLLTNPIIGLSPRSPDTKNTLFEVMRITHKFLFLSGIHSVYAASPKRAIWTSQDITNSNKISVDGQYALFRMCSRSDVAKKKAATSILAAIIDDETLAGIYQVDFKVPALRARDHLGKGWWDLIPKGQDSTCVEGIKDGKGNNAPLIVYRKDIGPFKERVEQAVQDAWVTCRKVYKLPEYEPIPCIIAKRAENDWAKCSPEKRDKAYTMFSDCVNRQTPVDVKLACLEKCYYTTEYNKQVDCIFKTNECSLVQEIIKTCGDYVDKHITCP